MKLERFKFIVFKTSFSLKEEGFGEAPIQGDRQAGKLTFSNIALKKSDCLILYMLCTQLIVTE